MTMQRTPRSRTRTARLASRALLALASLAAVAAASAASKDVPQRSTAPRVIASIPAVPVPQARTALRYDTDYPTLDYGGTPHENAIARLQERIDRGEVKLEFRPPRGYLDSILAALHIDPSSQTLVFSKTSLQIDVIRAATPRAIYFNDNTYVAWVQKSNLLEAATMDDDLGPVFYTMVNRDDTRPTFDRDILRCLACHDTFSLAGGGVPRFLFMSSIVGLNGEGLTANVSTETTDETPIRDRWAGWYVTGKHGDEVHLGNLQLHSAQDVQHIDQMRHGNIMTLDGLFDTRPYVTDKSDIVALLVFEHQAYVQNFITRVNYKARTILARDVPEGTAAEWANLPAKTRTALRAMIDPLVRALLFVDAARINATITSSSGFDVWFQKQGPRDPQGRSLRELDLHTRLFKYPLSYMIYSTAFERLPACAKEYAYTRLAAVLSGNDEKQKLALSADERKAITDILAATKPAFAQVVARSSRE